MDMTIKNQFKARTTTTTRTQNNDKFIFICKFQIDSDL